jgi:hypothetical protein
MPHSTGTALLTIRAWCEEGAQQPLRVEIRVANDVAEGFRTILTTVHAEAVVEVVRAFLDAVACTSAEDPAAASVSRSRHG